MTDPRGGVPEDAPKPIDDDAPVDEGEPAVDHREPSIEDAGVDAIEDELADGAETRGVDPDDIDADEADDDVDTGEAATVDLDDDYEAAMREVAGDAGGSAGAVPAGERAATVRRRAGAAPAARTPTPSEMAVHVREDVSKVFVIVTVAIFVLILLNGLLLGSGGLLRPLATPSPSPSPSPSVSASPTASSTGSASGSPSVSPSPPSPSPATASPAASPS